RVMVTVPSGTGPRGLLTTTGMVVCPPRKLLTPLPGIRFVGVAVVVAASVSTEGRRFRVEVVLLLELGLLELALKFTTNLYCPGAREERVVPFTFSVTVPLGPTVPVPSTMVL